MKEPCELCGAPAGTPCPAAPRNVECEFRPATAGRDRETDRTVRLAWQCAALAIVLAVAILALPSVW